MLQKIHQQDSANIPDPPRANSVAGMSKARVKTLKMTVVVVLAYIICWAPLFTVQLWSAWDTHAPKESATFTVLMLLASLNSCANPGIYLLFSGRFPKKLMALPSLWRRTQGKDYGQGVSLLCFGMRAFTESTREWLERQLQLPVRPQ